MAKNKSSKNKIIIAAAAVILLGIVAFFLLSRNKMVNLSPSGSDNAFTSIQDALSKSISLECEFTDESGRITKSYIKNGAVRADFTSQNAEESGSVIMKDKKMYFWNSKGGYTMELPDDVKTDTTTGETESQGSDILKAMEEFKDKCKPAVVSDSLFTPPTDVTFTDMSKLIPTGASQNGSQTPQMSQEEIQKYMQQYQDTAQ